MEKVSMNFIRPEYKFSDITAKIIAAAFEVHRIIGWGFLESVYHRAMEIELGLRKISFISEKELSIYYKNQKVGARRIDLFVENVVSTELKAVAGLDNTHLAQAINYIEAFQLEVVLLINFGSGSLEFRRLINPKLLKKNTGNK